MKFKRYDIFVRLEVLYTENIYNHAQLIEPLWKIIKESSKITSWSQHENTYHYIKSFEFLRT